MSTFRTSRRQHGHYNEHEATYLCMASFEWTYPLLAIAVLVHAYLCWRWRTDLAYDAKFAYLPYARQLLSEGTACFSPTKDRCGLPSAPTGHPALLAADVQAIEVVNVVLSGSIVLMLYRIATLTHSTRRAYRGVVVRGVALGRAAGTQCTD